MPKLCAIMKARDRLLKHYQTQTAIAEALGVSSATVSQWFSDDRPFPPLRALQIEQLTGGKIKAAELNPKCAVLSQ